MAENAGQPGPNLTGRHERNKVSGEGAGNTSQTSTGGGAGADARTDEDPDARPDLDLSDDPRGGPSMNANLEPGERRGRVEAGSFAPGGETVSQPGVEEEDLSDPSGEGLQRPSAFHDRQPRP